MFAKPLSLWLQQRGIHYAWVVAAVAFLTMLTSSAALGLPGAFLQPLSQEFGWSTDQISSAMAVRFVLFGLLGPFAAVFMARHGLRTMVMVAMSLIALGLVLANHMHALWQLVALWGVVLGVGSGLTALVLGAVVANRWFDQRRGLVLGMLTASSATGQLVFLPLAAGIIQNYGWRAAIFPIFVTCLLVAGLAFCFLRNAPHDIGLLPFGANPATYVAPVAGGRMSLWQPLRALKTVGRNATFWILAFTFFVCGLSTNGLIQTHFISLCGDYGLAALPAASVLAMIGGFDFFGTIASGWLSDRYDNRKLLFWYYGLRGLSLLWLPHSDFTLYGLSFFAMFYGLDWVATVPPTVKLASATFSKEYGAMVFGWIFAAHQIGGAVAAYGAGLSRTILLSYSPALYAAGAACVLAAVSVLWVRRAPQPGGLPVAAKA